MIVRITRARLKPQSESAVFDVLRAATAGNTRPPGMHSIMIGRRMDDSGNELVAITVWTDVEALRNTMGPAYQTAQFFPALDLYLVDANVEHFETVVETFEDIKNSRDLTGHPGHCREGGAGGRSRRSGPARLSASRWSRPRWARTGP